MTSSRLLGVLLVVCMCWQTAAGDTIVTKTGSRYEGKVEQEGDFYVLTKPGGGKIRLPRSTVKEVIKAPSPGQGKTPADKRDPAKKPEDPKRKTGPSDRKTIEDADAAWRNDIAAFTRKVAEVAKRSHIPDRRQLLESFRDRKVFTNRDGKPIMVVLEPLLDGELHGELAKTFTGKISWSGKVETIKKSQDGKSYKVEIAWPIPKDLPKHMKLRSELLLTVPVKVLAAAGVPKRGETFSFTAELRKQKPDSGEAVWVYYSPGTGKHIVGASPVNVRVSASSGDAKAQPDKRAPTDKPSGSVTIALAEARWLRLSKAQEPFGPYVDFKLACANRGISDKSATIVCELEYQTDKGKAVLQTLSFHKVKLARGDSKIDVHFQTLGMDLSGKGTLKVYLIREITAKPKPPRIYSTRLKDMVYVLNKNRIKQYDELRVQIRSRVISNVLRIPAAADGQGEAAILRELKTAGGATPPAGKPGEPRIVPSGWRPLKDLQARASSLRASDELKEQIRHPASDGLSLEADADMRSILMAYIKTLPRGGPANRFIRADPGAVFEVTAGKGIYRAQVGALLTAKVGQDKTVTLGYADISTLNEWNLPDGTHLPAHSKVQVTISGSSVRPPLAPDRQRPRPVQYANDADLTPEAYQEVRGMLNAYYRTLARDWATKTAFRVPAGQKFTVALGKSICKVQVVSGKTVPLEKDGTWSERSLSQELKALNDWMLSDGTQVPAQSKLRLFSKWGKIKRPLAPGEDAHGRDPRTPRRSRTR